MKDDYQAVYETLHRKYEIYRDNHPENPALELYDMDLDDAARRTIEIKEKQSQQ